MNRLQKLHKKQVKRNRKRSYMKKNGLTPKAGRRKVATRSQRVLDKLRYARLEQKMREAKNGR